MVVEKRVGAIIQARMGSSRLPGKILLPLPFGGNINVLSHIINRANSCPIIDKTVIATSVSPENDILSTGFSSEMLFRGSEEDVLSRFNDIVEDNSFDIVIRLTGDNPCIDFSYLPGLMTHFQKGGVDYLKTTGLPLGMNFEIISSKALRRAHLESTKEFEREHVTPYISSNSKNFVNHVVKIESKVEDLRLTLDYAADYGILSLIFQHLYTTNNCFGLKEIEELLNSYPWLKDINANNFQFKVFEKLEDELNEGVKQLEKMGLKNVSRAIKENLLKTHGKN
jgi:spore coat polysaccharide biosynthesis protein SpsF